MSRIDDILAAITDREWAAIADELTPDLEAAFRAAGVNTLSAFTVRNAAFGLIDKRAVAYASKRAAELVGLLSEGTRTQLRATIADAIEKGWSVGKLRAELVDNHAFSPVRALNIARTEIKQSRGQGNFAAATEAGAKTKTWHADEKACDICSGNEAAGEIPIGDDFPSGDSTEPAHPGCTCDVEYSA